MCLCLAAESSGYTGRGILIELCGSWSARKWATIESAGIDYKNKIAGFYLYEVLRKLLLRVKVISSA